MASNNPSYIDEIVVALSVTLLYCSVNCLKAN